MSLEEKGKKVQQVGKNFQGLGCLLTLFITIPLVLTIFFGPLGSVAGILIVILIGMVYKKLKEKEKIKEP